MRCHAVVVVVVVAIVIVVVVVVGREMVVVVVVVVALILISIITLLIVGIRRHSPPGSLPPGEEDDEGRGGGPNVLSCTWINVESCQNTNDSLPTSTYPACHFARTQSCMSLRPLFFFSPKFGTYPGSNPGRAPGGRGQPLCCCGCDPSPNLPLPPGQRGRKPPSNPEPQGSLSLEGELVPAGSASQEASFDWRSRHFMHC